MFLQLDRSILLEPAVAGFGADGRRCPVRADGLLREAVVLSALSLRVARS